jgi:putative membrane protein
MRFLIRLLITAASLWAAVALIPGIRHDGSWLALLGVALVFGAVNAVIRPLLVVLTCPLVVLTLGLFILVLNALMLWITGALSDALGLGFQVAGFGAAFFGGIVVAIVSTALNLFLGDRPREPRRTY